MATAHREKKRVLIVDDDPTICRFLTDFFEIAGFSVVTAESAEKGFDLLQVARPDIVLLDVVLPGMDGLSALAKMREMDPSLGVIVTTGLKDEETAKKAMTLGAYGYVVKPFDLEYLELMVQTRLVMAA